MANEIREKMVLVEFVEDAAAFTRTYNRYANATIEDDIHFDEKDEDVIVGCSGFQYLPDAHEGLIVLKVVEKVEKSKGTIKRIA